MKNVILVKFTEFRIPFVAEERCSSMYTWYSSMTRNQIEFLNQRETEANNRRQYNELVRHQKASEAEAHRNNLVIEGLRGSELVEQGRHNLAVEKETTRANKAQVKSAQKVAKIGASANKYAAKKGAQSRVKGAKIAAAASKKASKTSAAATKYAAKTSAQASKYASNLKKYTDLKVNRRNIESAETRAIMDNNTKTAIAQINAKLKDKEISKKEQNDLITARNDLKKNQKQLETARRNKDVDKEIAIYNNITQIIKGIIGGPGGAAIGALLK